MITTREKAHLTSTWRYAPGAVPLWLTAGAWASPRTEAWGPWDLEGSVHAVNGVRELGGRRRGRRAAADRPRRRGPGSPYGTLREEQSAIFCLG